MDIEERRQYQREQKARRRRENPEHERELRRQYYQRNKDKIAARNLEKRSKEREKAVARTTVQKALLAGELKVGECEMADGDCFGKMHAHHNDYSRPLDVRWICASHHMRMHSPLRSFADRGIDIKLWT